MSSQEKAKLSNEILAFLSNHALIAANYDPDFDDEEDKFNGPDPSALYMAAMQLKNDQAPMDVHSDWSSGCYYPYTNARAKEWHDQLVASIKKHGETK